MSAVRPEFGPSLPELAGPALRRLPRAARIALAALAVLVLALLVLRAADGGPERTDVIVREAVEPYTLAYDGRLERADPGPGETVRLTGEGLAFAGRDLRLPAYRGDSAGVLPGFVERLVTEMSRTYPEFLRREEGRANVNRQQGYQVFFQFRRDGRLWYGRRVLLLPTPVSRNGVDLTLLAQRTPAVAKATSVGQSGALKVPLRSVRFGTERP
jgi:hypothetical protein